MKKQQNIYSHQPFAKLRYWLLITLIIAFTVSCKKNFLDDKPRTDIVVPETLKDCQQLLDNYIIMNETPQLGELSADNFYLLPSFWNSLLNNHEKNGYIWAKDLFVSQKNIPDWNIPYKQVLYSNVVLETVERISPPTDPNEWKRIKGSALFTRAFAFYNIAQLFALPYNAATATNDLGIPLRLNSDINEKVVRSTVQQTYDKIIEDLNSASELLPDTIHLAKRNRPSKPAALALLSRVYLTMGKYDKSKEAADAALQLYNLLLDYNNPIEVRLQPPVSPFPRSNKELIYYAQLYSTSNVLQAFTFLDVIVDSTLYQSYDPNDLRSLAFYTTLFTGFPNIRQSYNGTIYPFTGLAVDELYLTRAECNAWQGKITEAMADLNTLLETRWITGTYTPFTASTQTEALTIILRERRKELAFRGLRWTDLRRLNKTDFKITLQRKINNDIHTLTPGSKNWVLPIPPDVISFSEIKQNVRE